MTLDMQPLLFSGAHLSGAPLHEIHDPGKANEIVGVYPLMDAAAVDGLVEAAAQNQPLWAALGAPDRWDTMRRAADNVDVDGLARILVREQGKPLAEATAEMQSLGLVLDRYRSQAEWLSEVNGCRGQDRTIRHRPFGVCAAITPWNWPYRIACALAVPALLAGNSLILHLAPSAPLAAAQAFSALSQALPEGVLSIVTHPDPVIASRLVGHPGIRKIAFTGSTGVGRTIMANAAPGLKSLTLELGGNDPAIILDDVHPSEEIADQLVGAAFATTGQVCMAIKRLYVPQRRVLDFVEVLSSRLDREVIGHGLSSGTTLGPLHTQGQLSRVQGLVDDAVSRGAVVSPHGSWAVDPSDGWYMRPVLVHGIDPKTDLVTEEQFGPALPIIGYSSEEEAVALANDSEFGLCSSVWSADYQRAFDVAEHIEAGTTWINKHGMTAQDPQAPFGGVKSSGVGRIGGSWGLKAFLEPHAIIA